MIEGIHERIKLVRKDAGDSQSGFAKKLGMTQNFIALLESGARNPSDRTLNDIVRVFGVNELWLRTGEGEMFKTATRNEEISKFFYDILKMEDEAFQKRFIAALANCTTDMWEAAAKFIEELGK